MIDLLGMILPGGLLLLLFEQDLHCLEDMRLYLDVGSGTLIWCTIFLCGSYLLGMLLHELGSILEKLETTIVIQTPRCWTTMVVFVFALQIAAFSSRTFLIQLDTGYTRFGERLCYVSVNVNEKVSRALMNF